MDIISKNIHWLLRISLAGTFIAHGYPKLGGDLGMGIIGYLVGPFEFFGAIFILVGPFTKSFLTRLGSLMIAVIMLGAIFVVHLPQKIAWKQGNDGIEWQVLLLCVSIYFLVQGDNE